MKLTPSASLRMALALGLLIVTLAACGSSKLTQDNFDKIQIGMTRAQERLYMTGATNRHLFGMGQRRIPSRFLRDIPEEIIHFEGRPTPLVPSSWAWEEGLFSEDRVIEYD